jgi:hypothetical protein
VLLRLAYLGVTNALAMLRLLPMSDHAKDAEILALRHQIVVLQRQLHGRQVRFAPADQAMLAALLHRLPRAVLHRIQLPVRPETVLRWHRDLIARKHARVSRPKRVGRPPTLRSIRVSVLRLARENTGWATGASTASYSSWVSSSPHRRLGRSSPTPGSTRHRSRRRTVGRRSCPRRPRLSSPPTSSKQ